MAIIGTGASRFDYENDRSYYEQKMLQQRMIEMQMHRDYNQLSQGLQPAASEQKPAPKPEAPKSNLKLLLLEQP